FHQGTARRTASEHKRLSCWRAEGLPQYNEGEENRVRLASCQTADVLFGQVSPDVAGSALGRLESVALPLRGRATVVGQPASFGPACQRRGWLGTRPGVDTTP